MRRLTKLMTLVVVALVASLAMAGAAWAQDVPANSTQQEGKGQITVTNAAKGEKYKVVKLFDASVTGTEGGAIAYTGDIPSALSEYFTKDSAGNISEVVAKSRVNGSADGEMSDGLKAALKDWAGTAEDGTVSDGSALNFNNLDYGYYVVCTTQGETAISVTSTNPTQEVVDKNTTEPNLVSKTVDDDNVKIGDTATYTVVFNTSNFNGAGESAKRIVSYTITDDLPEFLTDVTVTSIIVDDDANVETTDDQTALTVTQFNNNGEITIPWANEAKTESLYKNGAAIIITYTAVVTDKAAVDGEGNTNTVGLKWKDEDGTDTEDEDEVTATIYTYALALKKVDDEGKNLAGAKFQFPFYVKATPDADGAYIYAGTTAGTGLVNEITTPENGEITVKGLESGVAVSITETEAPAGFNKLTAPVSVTPVQTGETTTSKTWKIKDGQIVEDSVETTITTTYTNQNLAATPIAIINKSGAELPSTGGMGTTILYIIGAVLVIGAGVFLVTKRRVRKGEGMED